MLVYVPHKMRNYAFLLRSRAKQKYTNKCDARAKLLFCLLNLLFFPRSRCPPYRRIDVNCQNWPIIVYRVFPLTWPASTQIYWNRRKSLHKNIIQLPQDGLGHQHGRRFIVLRHQYGRRDVMWKHSVPGAGLSEWDFENNGRFPFDQNVRLEFSAISSSKWNSIFKNSNTEHNLVRNNQIFENSFRYLSFQSTLLSEFLEFSTEWFAFRKFYSFRNFWKLFREISVPFTAFSKVLVEWKATIIYSYFEKGCRKTCAGDNPER